MLDLFSDLLFTVIVTMEADSKPKVHDASGDDETINLSVKEDSSDAAIQFKIKKTTPLSKLMDAYCKRLRISKEYVRFLFDDYRLKDEDVPRDLGLVDGDEIIVVQFQNGGKVSQFK